MDWAFPRPLPLNLLVLALLASVLAVQTAVAYSVEKIPFEWTPIVGSRIRFSTNVASDPVPLPFAFKLNGVPFSEAYLSRRGFITFRPELPDDCRSGATSCPAPQIPLAQNPVPLIAGYWGDLQPTLGGSVSYATHGSRPDRVFIVQYLDVPHTTNPSTASFQIKLFEASNAVEIHSRSCVSDGTAHTQGIQSGRGFNLCYTTNAHFGLHLYGYKCVASGLPSTSERNAANFSLANDAVRFSPANNRSSIFPAKYQPTGDVVGMRYRFRVDQKSGPQFKLIFVPTGLWNFTNYSSGLNRDMYQINTFFFSRGTRYRDPICYRGFVPHSSVFKHTDEAEFSLQVPDYPGKGLTGMRTDDPEQFPRSTSLGAIDGIAASTGAASQMDIVGIDGAYQLTRGPLVSNKSGWHLLARNCDPTHVCDCYDAGLDSAHPEHTFRQWDLAVTLGEKTYHAHAALPEDAASSMSNPIAFLTEYFFTKNIFKVFLWDMEILRNNAAWEPLDEWEVGDHDGSTRYFGYKFATYRGRNVIEVSNDPAKRSDYLFGASMLGVPGFDNPTFRLSKGLARPVVLTGPATDIAGAKSRLHGIVNPQGVSEGEAWFEYGTTHAYGMKSPRFTTVPGADNSLVTSLAELSPGVPYHYRLVCQTRGGISYGEERTFFSSTPLEIARCPPFADMMTNRWKLPGSFDDGRLLLERYPDNRPGVPASDKQPRPMRSYGQHEIPSCFITNIGTHYYAGDLLPYVLVDKQRDYITMHPGPGEAASLGILWCEPMRVRLTGAFARANACLNAGDGVWVGISRNGDTTNWLWTASISSTHTVDAESAFLGTGTRPFDLDLRVGKGDVIRFLTYAGLAGRTDTAFDATALRIDVQLLSTPKKEP